MIDPNDVAQRIMDRLRDNFIDTLITVNEAETAKAVVAEVLLEVAAEEEAADAERVEREAL